MSSSAAASPFSAGTRAGLTVNSASSPRTRASPALSGSAQGAAGEPGSGQEETPETLRRAKSAGFVIIDMSDVYKGQDIATIRLAEWDDHPNRRGHELIASRLYDELQKKRETIFLPVSRASKN